jgi:hypothetical protein
MYLPAGATLRPYEILERTGAGGVGEAAWFKPSPLVTFLGSVLRRRQQANQHRESNQSHC